jgi:hypothetical protein
MGVVAIVRRVLDAFYFYSYSIFNRIHSYASDSRLRTLWGRAGGSGRLGGAHVDLSGQPCIEPGREIDSERHSLLS